MNDENLKSAMKRKLYFKKIVIFLLLILISQSALAREQKCVVICTGPKAYAYHSNSGCRGLNRCSAGIVTISLAEAKSMGRSACRICGGNPFICDIKTIDEIEQEEKFDRVIISLEKKIDNYKETIVKLNSIIDDLKFRTNELEHLNKALNSPYLHSDSILFLINDNIKKQSIVDKQIVENSLLADSLKLEIDIASNIRKLYEEKYDSLKYFENKVKTEMEILTKQIQDSESLISNANQIRENLNSIENLLNIREKKLESLVAEHNKREDELEIESQELNDRLRKFKNDLQQSNYIYPERLNFEIGFEPNYILGQSITNQYLLNTLIGFFYRFDIDNSSKYATQNRINKIGLTYSIVPRIEYVDNLAKIGQNQVVTFKFVFKEYLGIGLGYSYRSESNSNLNTQEKYYVPINFYFTRRPFILGIAMINSLNSHLKYLYSGIGISMSASFDFFKN